MAKFADVNNITVTGATAHCVILFAMKTQAKLAGWTVPRSSDGTTYNDTGDQITTAATGAGGLQNTGAWFILREPGGRREWCIQVNNSSGTHARIKYSALARFTGGTPGATRVPSASDEQVLIGTGIDASPTYASVFSGGAQRYHVVFESTPVGGAYYFGVFTTATGGATQSTGHLFQEPMASGSYGAADGDPVIVSVSNNASGWVTGALFCWFGYGTGSAFWSGTATITVNVGPFNGALGIEVGGTNDVNGRPWYSATVSGSVRIKGVGAFIAAKGPARTYPATMNTATDAYVYLGSFLYPYPNNTVPSVA